VNGHQGATSYQAHRYCIDCRVSSQFFLLTIQIFDTQVHTSISFIYQSSTSSPHTHKHNHVSRIRRSRPPLHRQASRARPQLARSQARPRCEPILEPRPRRQRQQYVSAPLRFFEGSTRHQSINQLTTPLQPPNQASTSPSRRSSPAQK